MTKPSLDSVSWLQLRFGKLVQQTGDAIVSGAEHGVTARSADFPTVLVARCHPTNLSVGDRDPSRWQQCPWGDRGGIVTSSGIVGDVPWVIVARQRERPEAGDGREGRRYTEMHVVATPAPLVTSAALAAVAGILVADPVSEADFELPPLHVPAQQSLLLVGEWLTRGRSPLAAIVSGVPLAIQDWTTDPDESFAWIATVLAALPTGVAWRIPIGAGLTTVDGAFAVATGMAARGNLRLIAGTLRQDDLIDLTVGHQYAEWLSRIAGDCKSTLELREAVDAALPEFAAIDALPIAMPWRTAVLQLGKRVARHQVTSAFLANVDHAETLPSLPEETDVRHEILSSLIARADGPTASRVSVLLEQSVRRWPDAWRQLLRSPDVVPAPMVFALAARHGMEGVDVASMLPHAATLSVDESIQPVIVHRLLTAVSRSQSAAAWLSLLSLPPTQRAAWVSRWREAAAESLVALALREALSAGARQSSVIDLLQEYPSAANARMLLEGRLTDVRSFSGLLDLIDRAEAIVFDVLLTRAPDPRAALDISERAHRFGVQTRRLEALHVPPLRESTESATRTPTRRRTVGLGMLQALRDVLMSDAEPGHVVMWLLLRNRSRLDPAARQRLALLVGDPWSIVLLDGPTVGRIGPASAVAAAFHSRENLLTDESIERLIAHYGALSAEARTSVERMLRSWIAAGAPRRGTSTSAAELLRVFAGASFRPYATIPTWSLEPARPILRALALPSAAAWRTRDVERLRMLATETPPGTLAPVLPTVTCQSLLREVLADQASRAWWCERLMQLDWSNERGWRWVAGSGQAGDEETAEVLRGLVPATRLQLLLEGWNVPDWALAVVTSTHLARARLKRGGSKTCAVDPEQGLRALRTILRSARARRDSALALEIAQQTIDLALAIGVSRSTLARILDARREHRLSTLARQLWAHVRGGHDAIDLLRDALLVAGARTAKLRRWQDADEVT